MLKNKNMIKFYQTNKIVNDKKCNKSYKWCSIMRTAPILTKFRIPLQKSPEYRYRSKDESTLFIVAMIFIVDDTFKNT